MNVLKKLILSALISFVFIGSVGLGVFSHLCSKDGLEVSYFLPQKDSCTKIEANSTKSCCHSPEKLEKEALLNSKKCCTESSAFYKLNTENRDEILKLKFDSSYVTFFKIIPEVFPNVFIPSKHIAYVNPGPPLGSGKEILVFNQVFRL